jgi:hypothetical protein
VSTEEVRSVSSTGAKKGVKRARFDMIPTDSLTELARHYGVGAEKYETGEGGIDNWRLGYEWSKSFAAAYRHLTAAMGGEDIDEETGSKHVIAVAWHMFVLAHWMNDPSKARFDDRQAVLEERLREKDEYPLLDPHKIHERFTSAAEALLKRDDPKGGLVVGGRYLVAAGALYRSGDGERVRSFLAGRTVTLKSLTTSLNWLHPDNVIVVGGHSLNESGYAVLPEYLSPAP